MAFEGFPFLIGWELTLACNQRCRHCGAAAGVPRPNELTTAEALDLCEQFPPLLVREVEFTGGEPLLRPDWPEIATRLCRLGIAVRVLTNGLTLDAAAVRRLVEAGVAGVEVRLDGLRASHDRLRSLAGSFEAARDGIRRALRAGLPVSVITTVHADNIADLPGMLSLLLGWGVRSWQLQPLFPVGRSRGDETRSLDWLDGARFGNFLSAWREPALDRGLDLQPGDGFGHFTEPDPRDPPWQGCPGGLLTCGITSDGRVKGCLSLPDDWVEGDLRQRELWDIWFDPAAFARTRPYATRVLGSNCRCCPHSARCRGGCAAVSCGATGEAPNDPLCFWGIRWHLLRLSPCAPESPGLAHRGRPHPP